MDSSVVRVQALKRVVRTVVVADLVESTRLMQLDELDVIDRWRRFVAQIVTELPSRGGRVVKSLGDGLLLDFSEVCAALGAAHALHVGIQAFNVNRNVRSHLRLRCAVHEAAVVVDALDLYGTGVNLAARLAALAEPGETIVSDTVREALAHRGEIVWEDMGAFELKNLRGPVQAWRVGAAHGRGREEVVGPPMQSRSSAGAVARREDLPRLLRRLASQPEPRHAATVRTL